MRDDGTKGPDGGGEANDLSDSIADILEATPAGTGTVGNFRAARDGEGERAVINWSL